MKQNTDIYGLMAEFLTAGDLLAATRQAREAGYRDIDAYTPYPVEGLALELGLKHSHVPLVVLVAGLVGAGLGYFMQYYTMAVDYPFNSGGRPYNSWPVFIPVTFEVMVLVAALSALFAMLYWNGLPRPHHPVFNVPQFARASQDRFFLCIEATDPLFDHQTTAEFLTTVSPHGEVITVPRDQPEQKEVVGEEEATV